MERTYRLRERLLREGFDLVIPQTDDCHVIHDRIMFQLTQIQLIRDAFHIHSKKRKKRSAA